LFFHPKNSLIGFCHTLQNSLAKLGHSNQSVNRIDSRGTVIYLQNQVLFGKILRTGFSAKRG